jgi:hypothetical protein
VADERLAVPVLDHETEPPHRLDVRVNPVDALHLAQGARLRDLGPAARCRMTAMLV